MLVCSSAIYFLPYKNLSFQFDYSPKKIYNKVKGISKQNFEFISMEIFH